MMGNRITLSFRHRPVNMEVVGSLWTNMKPGSKGSPPPVSECITALPELERSHGLPPCAMDAGFQFCSTKTQTAIL